MKYDEIKNQQTNGQPAQHQNQQPGIESEMNPLPIYDDLNYKGSGKLQDKVAIITGGDSGIGRAVAVAFAKEGAKVTIAYLNEVGDAEKTKADVEKYGGECLLLSGDIGEEHFCQEVVSQTVSKYGKIDCVVNNGAEQHYQEKLEDITSEQLERTFKTNIFSCFYITKAAMPHLKAGSSVINTASITAYKGNPVLMDYASTKGAQITFTRSLSENVVGQGIRVNAVAPGLFGLPLFHRHSLRIRWRRSEQIHL